jgi:phage terminase small subunit
MGALSPKQEKFVDEFLIDLNATQAAIRAGYSPKTAQPASSRLLSNVMVQAKIQERRESAQKRAEVSLDDVLRQYKRIAFAGMSKFVKINSQGEPEVDLSNCTPEDLDLLAETQIEAFSESDGTRQVRRVKIKTLDRLKALETLGKHLGLGDKAQGKQIDTLSAALIAISKQGSAAPIATARDCGH